MTESASPDSTYGIRFEFLVSTYFDVEAPTFEFELAGRSLLLKSVHNKSLRDTGQVAIRTGGFQNESEALDYAYRLQRASTLAATKTNLGVNVGRNVVRTGVSQEIKDNMLKKHGIVLRNLIHGVDVFKDDPPVHVPVVQGYETVRIDPSTFLQELHASFLAWRKPVSESLVQSLRLRAQANQSEIT